MEHNDKKKGINYNMNGITHFILLNSYLVFFFAFIIGAFLDPIFKITIFSNHIYKDVGFAMIILATIIIYWSQKSSKDSIKKYNKGLIESFFEFGPYKYLRNPTHLSLFFLTFGFSLVINSFFGVVLNIVAYIITRLFFLKKQERVLSVKHGQVYDEYKKRVKNWL